MLSCIQNIYLEPCLSSILRVEPSNKKAFSNKNKGHLGSRYTSQWHSVGFINFPSKVPSSSVEAITRQSSRQRGKPSWKFPEEPEVLWKYISKHRGFCLKDTPLKTNECPLKTNGWKMYSLMKLFLFRGHVSFQGCIPIPWKRKVIV